jgi:LmbE family N-acetylglucosaminyl deacetylase
VTFGPDGVTGHDTHVMVGRVADDAATHAPTRPALLHMAVTPSQWDEMEAWMAAHPAALAAYQRDVGENPRVGPVQPTMVTVPEADASVVVDTTDVVGRKEAAIACHASQGGAEGLLGILAAPATERFVPVIPVRSPRIDVLTSRTQP